MSNQVVLRWVFVQEAEGLQRVNAVFTSVEEAAEDELVDTVPAVDLRLRLAAFNTCKTAGRILSKDDDLPLMHLPCSILA